MYMYIHVHVCDLVCRKDNLVVMSGRITQMRNELYQRLRANGVKWDHMLKQRGMFSYTGLTGIHVILYKYKYVGYGLLLLNVHVHL